MLGLIRPGSHEHYVDNGCVHCPRRGRDVEVDFCTGCEWLTTIDLQAKPPYVSCRGVPASAMLMRQVHG